MAIEIETFLRSEDGWGDSDGVRRKEYQAQIKGHPEIWVAGSSPEHAVGKLICCRADLFGIKTTFLERTPR